MTCEISGEPLGSIKAEDNIVVTPSGHICIKRLLLSKLAENGGMDPFEGSNGKNGLPLSENQLVTLQRPSFASSSSTAAASSAPPRPQATSLPNLLGLIQQEYDALVLELFDTRKALEETRRELSQALYQNDAAIRVVARLSQERDQARHELEQWNASVGAGGNGAAAAAAVAAQNGTATEESKPPAAEDNADNEEPTPKRRRLEPLDPNAPPLQNVIPPTILEDMDEAWTKLNAERKPMIKAMAAEAPTPETLAEYQDVDQKAWHKSTCKGVPCMAKSGDLIVTAGKDKQLVVYHEVEEVVKQTLTFGSVATCVDIGPIMVAAGDGKGKITAYAQDKDGTYDTVTATTKVDSAVVDVQVHPTQRYVVAATADGDVLIFALVTEEEPRLQQVSSFKNDNDDGVTDFTCGALHPDGLMYVAGTKQGSLIIWDFRNQELAATLKVSSDKNRVSTRAICCFAVDVGLTPLDFFSCTLA